MEAEYAIRLAFVAPANLAKLLYLKLMPALNALYGIRSANCSSADCEDCETFCMAWQSMPGDVSGFINLLKNTELLYKGYNSRP